MGKAPLKSSGRNILDGKRLGRTPFRGDPRGSRRRVKVLRTERRVKLFDSSESGMNSREKEEGREVWGIVRMTI